MITHYYDGHKSITTLLLTVRQGALQEQGVDVSAALSLLSTAPSRILTNMAGKRDSVTARTVDWPQRSNLCEPERANGLLCDAISQACSK